MSIRPATALLHAASLSYLAYGYLSLESTVADEWIRKQKGGHWQFLTIQGLAAAWVTILFSLLADFLPGIRSLVTIKRKLLMVSLPTASVISIIYWSLIAFAPSLILPPNDSPSVNKTPIGTTTPSSASEAKPALAWVPLPVDLALHAAPALSLVFDFFFLEQKYVGKEANVHSLLSHLLFGVWYASWVEYLATFNKAFPYPFLNVPFTGRAAIYLSTTLLAYSTFRLLNSLHRGSPLARNVEVVQKKAL